MHARVENKPSTRKRMIVMVLLVLLLIAIIAGVKVLLVMRMMAGMKPPPPPVVTTTTAGYQEWQPELSAVGTLRAVRGVDVASEVSGLVTEVPMKSGSEVKKGDVLLHLRDADDVAKLQQLQATLHLAQLSYERAKKQIVVHTIAQADYDTAQTNLEKARADVAAQAALVAKKTIRAPFDGKLGITMINPGQYINPGDRIVTLQQLDPIYADFFLPQRNLGELAVGSKVALHLDAYPGKRFEGKLTAINSKVDPDTRNVQIEAAIANPEHVLAPGMFANVAVETGKQQRYLTLPQTAVVFNPYGQTVYVVKHKSELPDTSGGKAGGDAKAATKPAAGDAAGDDLAVQQVFVTTGPTRGDQVAVLTGLKAGEVVVTSGQVKLKSGMAVTVDNRVRPENNPNPTPQER
ncbi:MAG TPA: efflux RND transporter periplasmic adaptor subunit [Mizugakiibacter sp.]